MTGCGCNCERRPRWPRAGSVTQQARICPRFNSHPRRPEWTTFAPTHADIQAALDRRAQ